jgi:phage-related protein
MVDYGQLMVTMVAPGVTKTLDKLEEFQKQIGGTFRKIKPQLENLTKGFIKFSAVSLLAFTRLIAASPRLRAQMEILSFRVNTLTRGFGDALAPAIELLSDSIATLTEWFKGLPEPLQDAIHFGGALAVAIGLLAGAFLVLSVAMTPVTAVILGIIAAGALLHLVWTENLFGIQEIAEPVFEALTNILEAFITLIDNVVNAFRGILAAFSPVTDFLSSVVVAVLTAIGNAFSGLINIITDVVDFLAAIASGDLLAAMNAFAKIFEDAIQIIIDLFILFPLEILAAIGDLGLDLIAAFDSFLNSILDLFHEFVTLAGDAAKDIIEAFIDGLIGGLTDAVDAVSGAIDDIAGLFGGSLPEWGPLKDALPGGADMASKYFEDMASQIIDSKGLIDTSLSSVAIGFTEPNPFQGIGGVGFVGESSRVEHRTIHIEKIELVIPGATTDSATGFLNRLDEGLRGSTKF